MADQQRSIFNQKATEKLRNPDDLDKCVRMANPSVLVVLIAAAALLLGLLAWGFFGAVSTSVNTTSVVSGQKAVCFLSVEDAAKVHEGDIAQVGDEHMEVAEIGNVPLSRDEGEAMFSSKYLASTLVRADWVYMVTFEGDVSDLAVDVPLPTQITVDRVAPISVFLGG